MPHQNDSLEQTYPAQPATSIYSAHGKFAFGNGHTIHSTDNGIPLRSRFECTDHLKKGTLNGRRITYISKMWHPSVPWTGFYKEIHLYANQLRPLQGNIIPYFIGVYDGPSGRLSSAMDLPHTVRWKAADTNIREDLKEKIIAAFEKIHERGVYHGDIALRHILIGDDEKISIINFDMAHTITPVPDVGLDAIHTGYMDYEMRLVRFVLDYKGAMDMEWALIEQKEAIDKRNRDRLEAHEELRKLEEGGRSTADLTAFWSKFVESGLQTFDEEEHPVEWKSIAHSPIPRKELSERGQRTFEGKWFEVPESYRYSPIETKPVTEDFPTSEANMSHGGMQKRRRVDPPGASESVPKRTRLRVDFHPDTIDNEGVPDKPIKRIQRAGTPVPGPQRTPKALANDLSSDRGDRGGSPVPSLREVEPPRRSPLPELRPPRDAEDSLDMTQVSEKERGKKWASDDEDTGGRPIRVEITASKVGGFVVPPPSITPGGAIAISTVGELVTPFGWSGPTNPSRIEGRSPALEPDVSLDSRLGSADRTGGFVVNPRGEFQRWQQIYGGLSHVEQTLCRASFMAGFRQAIQAVKASGSTDPPEPIF